LTFVDRRPDGVLPRLLGTSLMFSRLVSGLLLVAILTATALSCRSRSHSDSRSACLACAVFGDPAESPYVLPYAVGTSFRVFQTYCGPYSHGKDGQMSIDFTMPVGTEVLAARGGVVRKVVDRHGDFGRAINYMYIEHDDGTSAFYAHLTREGAKVAVGERVAAGQVIALSGASGTSLPHLHFGVASSWPPRRPDDVPVNFRNAEGPLDERGGLQAGTAYVALTY